LQSCNSRRYDEDDDATRDRKRKQIKAFKGKQRAAAGLVIPLSTSRYCVAVKTRFN
jgi:hypothetical protein